MMKRILFGLAFIALGAAGLYLVQRAGTQPETPAMDEAMTTPPASIPDAAESRHLTLSAEARERAGIQTTEVQLGSEGAVRRTPGTVEPHGYRVVDVTPLVSGTVVEVRAELGQGVRQGAVVARVRSPDLTDEVRRWLTLRAEQDVVTRRLARTQSLAKIGAASRQDLEEDEAALVRVSTDLESSRSRLARLGVPASRLASLGSGDELPEIFDVIAPAGGVVIARVVNPGQNVDASEPIVTLADRAAVWIMADVFEADLAHVRVGQRARVTSEAFPGREWAGRVAYLDPTVAKETRTVSVRVEVANPDEALRFGMFVSVDFAMPGAGKDLVVPASAIQSLGAVDVAYVEDSPGQFAERVVRLGSTQGTSVVVVSGLESGDSVVTAGSFALRAERDRLGWPAPVPPSAPGVSRPSPESSPPPATPVPTRVVEITAAGLVPARVTVPANQAVDLVFIRRVKDDETCGTEVEIPALKVRRVLPLDERVTIRLPPQPPGELSFSCGMDMLKGVIIVSR